MLQVNVNVSRKNWLSHYQLHNYVTALHVSQKVKDKNDEGAPKNTYKIWILQITFQTTCLNGVANCKELSRNTDLVSRLCKQSRASDTFPAPPSVTHLSGSLAGKSDGDPLSYSLTTLSNWLYDKVPILWRHPRGTNTGALTCLSFGSLPNFTALSNFVTHSPLCLTRSTTSQLTSSEYPGDILVATILAPCLSFTK